MKKLANLLTIGLGGLLCLSALRAQADLEVSASVQIHADADFYAPLASCGTWVEVGPYGRCWRPAGVVVGWRPYCNGYWVWTDCGWYWESDEPWAWACYHYGSWVYDPDYGWIWVPGVEWAPAWVCWRFGGGFVGWAPIGFHAHRPNDAAFVFVDNDHFGGHISSRMVTVNNPAIIRQTRFISNTEHATRNFDGGPRKVIVNEGPGLAVMEKTTGKRFETVPVRDADRRTPVPSSFQHTSAPTGINHEQKTYTPPNHSPPVSNERENGNSVPSKRNEPDQGGVPTRPPDSSHGQYQGQGQGGDHGHGHDRF